MLALLLVLLLLPWQPPGAGARADPTIEISEYPAPVAGAAGTIIPVAVSVAGEFGRNYEVAAWFYHSGSASWPSEGWDGEGWFRVNYFAIFLDGNGEWSGIIWLRLKEELPAGSYLKAKVRDTNTTSDYGEDRVDDIPVAASFGWVQGYAGDGDSAWEDAHVELRASGTLAAGNLTEAQPWQSQGDAGFFRLAAPAGDYTLRMADGSAERTVTVVNGQTTETTLGYGAGLTLSLLERPAQIVPETGTLFPVELRLHGDAGAELRLEIALRESNASRSQLWNGSDWADALDATLDGNGTWREAIWLRLTEALSGDLQLAAAAYDSGELVANASTALPLASEWGWLAGALGPANGSRQASLWDDATLVARTLTLPLPWPAVGDAGNLTLAAPPGSYRLVVAGVLEQQVEIVAGETTLFELGEPLPEAALELLELPQAIAGGAGTLLPLKVRFQGVPGTDYEIMAWFYGNGSMRSQPWDGSEWRNSYQPLALNGSLGWEGTLWLRLDSELPAGSYLKIKVRNAADTADFIELKTTAFAIPPAWGSVVGYVGNSSAPHSVLRVELRNTSGLVAANLSQPGSWGAGCDWGRYRLAAPPGDYTVRLPTGEWLPVSVAAGATARLDLGHTPPASGGHGVLLEWVWFDPWLTGEADEAISIFNTGPAQDVGGWLLGDAGDQLCLPRGTLLAAGERLVLAQNATAFFASHHAWPDFQMLPDGSGVPALEGSPFYLRNLGDIVELRDRRGVLADAVAWGEITGGDTALPAGWSGATAELPGEGRYLHRNNASGAGYRDTDSAADWASYRQLRPGQSDFASSLHAARAITAFASPDSTFDVLRDLLQDAESSIDLSLYYLNHTALVDELLAARDRGVQVRVLLEGSPVAGFASHYRYHAAQLVAGGVDVRLMLRVGDEPTRYPYIHAKYLVVDGRYTAVMSENWGSTGIPTEGSGNRGWGVVVESDSLASSLTAIFETDFDTAWGDVVAFDTATAPADFTPVEPYIREAAVAPRPPLELEQLFEVQLVAGPDNTLHNSTVMGLLTRAESRILVQQHHLTTWWSTGESPYLEALLAAHERGVAVTVMLDGTKQEVADNNRQGFLALQEAGVAVRYYRGDEFTRIHNKALVVDDRWTLVGSINWGVGGGAWNREIGLILDSTAVASYYSILFWDDWALANGSAPPPPPAPGGGDSGQGLPALPLLVGVAALAVVARRKRWR